MARISFRKKVLYLFCSLSLLPLVGLSLFATQNLDNVENLLRDSAIEALDQQAAEMLELRAVMVANEVKTLLHSIENDLGALAKLSPTPENYLWFSNGHRRPIWIRSGTNEDPTQERPILPLYKEIAYIDPYGQELIRVVDDHLVDDLRNVSNPANTTYLTETYFNNARDLPPGRIYVSHLTGWHVNKEDQLQGAKTPEEAIEGKPYVGVIRFARPVHDQLGRLEGVVVLSLDHQHLMELTQHISPTDERFVVFPSYQSGNYAFMFDNEGWIITHPKFWDIRGLDRDGHLVPPYTEQSTPEAIAKGTIPYNLREAAFVHPNYPKVHQAVMGGRSGVVDVTNVGGSRKIMAYAPIFYSVGPYAETGVFGGVTIGAEVEQFHTMANVTSTKIRQLYNTFLTGTWVLIALIALVVVLVAYHLSHTITEPLSTLMAGTQQMARGHLATQVEVESPVEVAELATSFNTMARQLSERRERLLRTLSDLRRSRQEIQRERDFNQTIVENVDVGILTLDNKQQVTSLNGPARRLLQIGENELYQSVNEVFVAWPELREAISRGHGQDSWSDYVSLERDGRVKTFRIALHPLSSGRYGGQILTLEDLTERVSMRQQMARIERLASLGRLSAGIAHEVRNPLTGISLLLDELHDRLLGHPADRHLIQKALHEIERLEILVNELLTFASLPDKTLARGDVAEILRDTLFLVKKQCQRQQVELVEELPPSILHPRVDADRLKQAFLNLITNALDAMPTGGLLRVTAQIQDNGVKVTVADSGSGIAAERVPLVFEPFYTTKGEGTGLGLSITHTIIDNHGGRIEVKSASGQGATFIITLPLPG